MKTRRKMVKEMINLSFSVEEADKVIRENYDFKSFGEKVAFLRGMFDVEVVSVHDADGVEKEKSDEITYFCLLNAIVNIGGC